MAEGCEIVLSPDVSEPKPARMVLVHIDPVLGLSGPEKAGGVRQALG